MAFGPGPGVSVLRTQTILQQLLEEINFQRTKEMRQQFKDDSGFVILPGTTYWTDLFVRNFLFQAEPDHSIDSDDLLFFVRKKHVKGTSRHMPKYETDVDVFRKDSRKLPIGDPDVDWEETVYLNLIIHQFNYTLTLAICTRTSPKELQVLRRHSQRVYASPSRRKMDTKGDSEEMTYPHICFMVDNFDEVFSDIVVRDGEMVCVELVASDRDGSVQGVIFLGSIRYDALKNVYDSRQSSLSSKVAQRMTFGLFNTGGPQTRCEFVRMKGPQGKGHAEMAVTKPKGSGVETPTSEPGFCVTDMWDEWNEDPDAFYNYRHQRRLSDPSSNLNYYSRYGWKTKTISNDYSTTFGAKARSENEGLDSIANELSEIEAGDLRDDRPASLASANAADSIINNKYNITAIRQLTTSIRLIPSTMKQPQNKTSNKNKKIEYSEKNKTTKCCNCFNTNKKSWTKSDNTSEQMSDIYCRICDDINSPACLDNIPHQQLNGKFIVKNLRNVLNLESELEIPNVKYDGGGIKTICNINTTLLSNPNEHTLINVSTRNINNHVTNNVEPKICINTKKNEEYELADDATSYNGCHDNMILSALHDNIKIFNEIDSNLRTRSVQGKVELPAKEQKHLHRLAEFCKEMEFNHPSTLLINKNITKNELSGNIHSILPLNNYNKSTNVLNSFVLDKHFVCKNDNHIEITSNDIEITDKNNNIKQRHSLINRNFSTLPKVKKKSLQYEHQHQDYLLNKLCNKIPMHTTPDGTNIYYWCEVPKKTLKELDDGAYNPLWATKGFTQTFHFWKEHRRQQSIPLNAFLTYVKLPWWSIAKDLLDHRETPILTF